MNFRDYKDSVMADAIDVLESNGADYWNDAEDFAESLWTDDSVTGNGSGSYTFSAARAVELVDGLIWDDEFIWQLECVGMDLGELVNRGPEAVDVTARCLALSAISYELQEYYEDVANPEISGEFENDGWYTFVPWRRDDTSPIYASKPDPVWIESEEEFAEAANFNFGFPYDVVTEYLGEEKE